MDTFTLRNVGKGPVEFSISAISSSVRDSKYELRINPAKGTIKKHKELEITITLIIKENSAALQEILFITIEDGKRIPVMIRARCETAVFGVNIETMPMSTVTSGSKIPTVLLLLESKLYSMDGLSEVGIFRLAPDEYEVGIVKKELNSGTFVACEDVNCIANLIKVWFRELPQSVLSSIPVEELLAASTLEDAMAIFAKIPSLEKGIVVSKRSFIRSHDYYLLCV